MHYYNAVNCSLTAQCTLYNVRFTVNDLHKITPNTLSILSRLFEACALMKHYQLVFDQKKTATVEEKQMLASGVLMATLAIPLPASMSENEKYLDLQVCLFVRLYVQCRLCTVYTVVFSVKMVDVVWTVQCTLYCVVITRVV